MKAPERIYLTKLMLFAAPIISNSDNDIEYIRKDVVDDMLATAEDHAYFAGSERAKEKLTDAFIEKACDAYCKVCGHYHHTTPVYICRRECDYYDDFRACIKGE